VLIIQHGSSSLRTFSADTSCLNLCYLNVPQQSLKKNRHQPACSSCFPLQGSAASLEFSSISCSLTNIFFSVQLQHLQIFLLVSKLLVSDVTFEPSLCGKKKRARWSRESRLVLFRAICYRENHVTNDKRLCKNVIGSVCGSARATLWLFQEQ